MIGTDNKEMRSGPLLSQYTTAVLGYPASRGDTLSIEQIANRLMTDLFDAGVFDDFNEVYFVAHSLGGLIVKEIFIDLKIQHPKESKKVTSIFLISSPSQGAPAANFLGSLPNIISGRLVSDLQTIDINTYLQSLESQWQAVLRNRMEKYPRVFCAYETQKTGPVTIVSQVYTSTMCDETPRAENSDHIDIVKPRSKNDSIYRWVRGRIGAMQLKECRLPAHGFEKWGKEDGWEADSGWRGGGSDPQKYCVKMKEKRKAQFPNREITLVNTDEDHKTERTPFKHDFYKYHCWFKERWQPIYKLAFSEECN